MEQFFLFSREVIRFLELMGFEYRVFYGSWKFSRLMGFEPIRENAGNVIDFVVKYFKSNTE